MSSVPAAQLKRVSHAAAGPIRIRAADRVGLRRSRRGDRRAAGLSPNKARSLRDLAAKVLDGTVVLSPRGLSRQSGEEVIARLSTVRGIGPLTARMAAI